MNCQKLLHYQIGLTLIALFLVGCNVPALTATPVPPTAREVPPTVTPVPSAATEVPPTAMPASPTATQLPSPTLDTFASGGLGLSKAQWEQEHSQSDAWGGLVEYDDGKYLVSFVDDRIQHLEWAFAADEPTLTEARAQAKTLIPEDSQFLETYNPEGFPELNVDLYLSESLKERFDTDWFIGGDRGNFIVVCGVFDGNVPRIVIATGNNP